MASVSLLPSDLGAHLRDGGVHEQNAIVKGEKMRIAALPVQEVDAMAKVLSQNSASSSQPTLIPSLRVAVAGSLRSPRQVG